jgi:hypothetical protein
VADSEAVVRLSVVRDPAHAPDAGSIVLGWLVRVAVVLGVLGVLAFDGIALGTAHLSLADQATTAAQAASDRWIASHDVQAAYDAAVASAREANPDDTVRTDDFTVTPDGHVTLTLEREAHSLVLRSLPMTRAWVHVVESGSAHQAT